MIQKKVEKLTHIRALIDKANICVSNKSKCPKIGIPNT